MDHTCHQCGHEIEEGTPFCRNCGAPQIRIPGLEEPASPPMPPGTPGEVQPPAEPVVIAQVPPPPPPGVDWSQALPVAGWVAVWLAILMVSWVVPFIGMLFFMFSVGVVGVMVYERRTSGAPLSGSSGARIGAVCGLFGFAATTVISGIFFLLLRGMLRETLQHALQQAAAANPDPNAQQVMAWMTSPAGMAAMVTISMVMLLFLFVGAASAGGAVGTTILRKGSKRTQL